MNRIVEIFDEKISKTKYEEVMKMGDKAIFIKHAETYFDEIDKGAPITDLNFTRHLMEILQKHLGLVIAEKKMKDFETRKNKESQYLNRINSMGYERNLYAISKNIGSVINKELSRMINSIYKSMNSSGSHKTVELSDEIREQVKTVIKAYFIQIFDVEITFNKSDVKTGVSASEIAAAIAEDMNVVHDEEEYSITSYDALNADEPVETKNLWKKGWIRDVKYDKIPGQKVLHKWLTFVPYQRGFNASQRECLEILCDDSTNVNTGLTYQLKFKTNSNGISVLDDIKKWEKPEIVNLMFEELDTIVADFIEIDNWRDTFLLAKPATLADEYTAYRFFKSPREFKVNTKERQVAEFFKHLEENLHINNIHLIEAFTNFSTLISDSVIDSQSVQQVIFDTEDESLKTKNNLAKNLIKNLDKMSAIFFLRNKWDKKAFNDVLHPTSNNSEWKRKSWFEFTSHRSLKNPPDTQADTRLIVQSRISSKDFLQLPTEEKVGSLVARLLNAEINSRNSSVAPIESITKICWKISRVFEEMLFYNKGIRKLISSTSTQDVRSILEVADWFRENRTPTTEGTFQDTWNQLNDFFKIDKYFQFAFKEIDDSTFVYIEKYGMPHENTNFYLEEEVGEAVAAFSKRSIKPGFLDDSQIEEAFKKRGLSSDAKQVIAINEMFKNPITIMIGKAGSGKTTTISVFLDLYKKMYPDHKILIATPTGTAAMIISKKIEIRDVYVKTIDSVKDDIDPQLIIFEESSMISLLNLKKCFPFMRRATLQRMIFLGDDGQLPSIGIGDLLNQFKTTPLSENTVTLETNHRQANAQNIFDLANTIRDYDHTSHVNYDIKFSDLSNTEHTKIENIEPTSKFEENFLEKILDNYDPTDSRVILTPRNVGYLGAKNINNLMQVKMKEIGKSWITDIESYSKGSRIMWIKNITIYTAPGQSKLVLPNGSEGVVKEINTSLVDGHEQVTSLDLLFEMNYSQDTYEFISQAMNLKFTTYNSSVKKENLNIYKLGSKYCVEINFKVSEDISEVPFVLNYATTFHKVQGGQFNMVDIILEDDGDEDRISREHLYTAVTRAVSNVSIYTFNKSDEDGNPSVDTIKRVAAHSEQRQQFLGKIIADKMKK